MQTHNSQSFERKFAYPCSTSVQERLYALSRDRFATCERETGEDGKVFGHSEKDVICYVGRVLVRSTERRESASEHHSAFRFGSYRQRTLHSTFKDLNSPPSRSAIGTSAFETLRSGMMIAKWRIPGLSWERSNSGDQVRESPVSSSVRSEWREVKIVRRTRLFLRSWRRHESKQNKPIFGKE